MTLEFKKKTLEFVKNKVKPPFIQQKGKDGKMEYVLRPLASSYDKALKNKKT